MVTRKSATSTGLTAIPDEDIVPLDVDHSDLVKFHSQRDDAYLIVKEQINSLLHDASSWKDDRRYLPRHFFFLY